MMLIFLAQMTLCFYMPLEQRVNKKYIFPHVYVWYHISCSLKYISHDPYSCFLIVWWAKLKLLKAKLQNNHSENVQILKQHPRDKNWIKTFTTAQGTLKLSKY